MSTRTELLTEISQLPASTLEQLVQYNQTFLTPDADLLTKVNFSQMVAKVHEYANAYFPEWTDRSESDFGQFLVEIFALFSEKDFWYLNAFAKEAFLPYATSYIAAYMHARRLGYLPTPTVGAKGYALCTFAAGDSMTINPGEIILVCQENGLEYSNANEVLLAFSEVSSQKNIQVVQGLFEVVTKPFNGKSIKISDIEADLTNVVVEIGGTTWLRVDSFASSDAFSKHFVVYPSDSGIEIFFGNDGYGERPAVRTSVTIRYLKTSGISGNVPPIGASTNTFTVKKYPAERVLAAATYLTAIGFTGGTTRETLAQVKYNASAHFRNRGSICNAHDLELYLTSKPTISKAKAYEFLHVLYFSVVLSEGEADQSLLDLLALEVQPIMVMGYTSYGNLTEYVPVNSITLTAYAVTGFSAEEVEGAIKDFLVNYTDPRKDGKFGRGFIISDVVAGLLKTITGLQNAIINSVNGVAAADIVIESHEILSTIPVNNINVQLYVS